MGIVYRGSPAGVIKSASRWNTYPRKKQDRRKIAEKSEKNASIRASKPVAMNKIMTANSARKLWNRLLCRQLVAGSIKSGITDPMTTAINPQVIERVDEPLAVPSQCE